MGKSAGKVGKKIAVVGEGSTKNAKIESDKKIDLIQNKLFDAISEVTKENEVSIFEIFEAMSRVSFAYNKRFLNQHIKENETK